jgi:hypothetical protein
MAWSQASKPGDTDPLIPGAKTYLRRFDYGKNLGITEVYTVEFGSALLQFQSKRKIEVEFGQKPGPVTVPNGIFDWASKKQMGLLVDPVKPLIVTVAGHLCNQFDGPAYICAKWMVDQRLAREMAIGYNNVDIPFENRTGFDQVMQQIHDPVILPRGNNWAICGHSQGAIIVADILDVARKNPGQWPWTHLKGGLQFGNPRRPRGVVAPWVADPPDPNSEGIAHNCMESAFPNVAEVSRKGDLYADKTPDSAGEYKTAVYRIIAEKTWFGSDDTLGEQMAELVKSGGIELWDVFLAITSGIKGAVHLDQHNIFDLGPCIDHLRKILSV